ncbi:hypothetical protein MNBD_GAMMA09-46, partial [hydrothermal vent metagenome]
MMHGTNSSKASEIIPCIARVAVQVPLYGLFDYIIPSSFKVRLLEGCRVRVAFGRKPLVGMVMSVSDQSSFPANKLKPL